MNKYAVRTITCKGCGKIVTGHMRPNQGYCSLACYRISRRPQRQNGQEVACELCGKPFYLPAKRLELAKHYFCCTEHANDWQGRNKTSHVCKMCGKSFLWSASRGKANNVKYCSIKCRDADPDRALLLRRMNAKQLTKHPNNFERLAYTLLDEFGVPYERQYLIGDKFCVDAFIPSVSIVVQFDGDYWHGNPAKFPAPSARQTHRMALDRSQDAYMQACGYRVIRIWESDFKHNRAHVIASLRNALALK